MTVMAHSSSSPALDLLTAQDRGRWGRALVVVLALHVSALAVAVLWRGERLVEPRREEMAVSLELAPLPAEDKPADPEPTAAPQPAAPQPVERPRPVVVEQPQPQLPVETLTPVAVPDVPVATPAPPSTASIAGEGAPTAASGSGPADAAGSAIQGTAVANSGGRGGGDAAAAWRGRVLAHLDRHKRYPRAAKMMKREGRAEVRLRLDRDGHVLDVALTTSAGLAALDEEAVEVVRRSQPLPPPPPEVAGENIPMLVPIGFTLR